MEPWLRGPIDDLHPIASHLLYTFQQAREELPRDLTKEQVWRDVSGSVGFHLRHMAGSIDRLSTYLAGEFVSEEQLAFLKGEHMPGADLATLLADLETVFARVEAQVRAIPVSQYTDARGVGRKALPTTVAGLMIHLSEHTQRHLGQVVLLAKIVRGRP